MIDKKNLAIELVSAISKNGKNYNMLKITVIGTPLGDVPLSNQVFLSELDIKLLNSVK